MNRNRARSVTLALALAASGCSIPLSDIELGPVNQCTASSDCATGAVCASVNGAGTCVATEADLPGLILEVRPHASSAFGPNVSFLVDVAQQGLALQDIDTAGQVRGFDPQLSTLARVDGKLHLPEGAPRCEVPASGDRSFPASAVFRRVAPFFGLPPAEYTASAVTEADDAGNLIGYAFHADLPKGKYDIYVVPEVPMGCTNGPLPVFLAQTDITGATNALNIDATPKRKLAGQLVEIPLDMSVDGWSLELVEPKYGALLSQTQTLAHPQGESEVAFDVDYDWTDQEDFTPIVRLRPPEGKALPALHWDLDVVFLMNPDSNAQLSLSELDAVRHVEGQVLDDSGQPVVATVQFQSMKLDQDSAQTFRLEADTDEAGVFAADLPPGRYRVVARPVDLTKAVAAKEIEFPADEECFCGQSIVVPDMGVLRGSVSGPAGEPMDPAYVVAAPSPLGETGYFAQFIALQPPQPREAATQLSAGMFALEVDPGTFDFSVRPPDGLGYPWLVRPRLFVAPSDIAAASDLDPMTVSYPAILHGVIRDPAGGALAGAVVRAWLPVSDHARSNEPAGVIQIGETLAQIDGSYILPLPPSLSE